MGHLRKNFVAVKTSEKNQPLLALTSPLCDQFCLKSPLPPRLFGPSTPSSPPVNWGSANQTDLYLMRTYASLRKEQVANEGGTLIPQQKPRIKFSEGLRGLLKLSLLGAFDLKQNFQNKEKEKPPPCGLLLLLVFLAGPPVPGPVAPTSTSLFSVSGTGTSGNVQSQKERVSQFS